VSASPSRGAILLDIEGTTTPIAYVYDVLFPYARRALPAYVEKHLDDAHLREPIARLRQEWQEDVARGERPPAWREDEDEGDQAGQDRTGLDREGLDRAGRDRAEGERAEQVVSIAAYARWLMDRDRKAFGLKALQGHITKEGYEGGSLHGEVYPDVPIAFERWRKAGIPVAIFSSGSALAQQMLFRTTLHGDLTRWIGHFFDTSVGPKRSPESYRRIASDLGCDPARVLFISDVSAELDAAREAGCDTRLCIRGGPAGSGAPTGSAGHTAIYDFNDVM
jgi:enolase-phosphatase E1